MSASIPPLKRHKTGQGYCYVQRRCYYFGRYGTPECRAKYEQWVSQYLMNGRQPPDRDRPTHTVTVNHVLALYLPWAQEHYVKHGKPTRQYDRIRIACRPLAEGFGDLPAAAFGVTQMERVQAAMVARGWTRGYCNTCLSVLKGIWRWAGLRELIPMEQVLRLAAVPGLRRGKTTAPESARIEPVNPLLVEQTLPHLGHIPAAMVRVQLLTGMRPGEVCLLRPADLDRSRTPWVFTPSVHKNEHRDQERPIRIGPQARALLAPFLLGRAPDEYLFDPALAHAEAVLASGRRLLRACKPGKHYSVHGYTQAVVRACARGGLERWTPLQLRHTRGTEVRAQFGPDAARALLGQHSLNSTQIYAELDGDAADRIAEQTG